jgi:low temperature requirement protein LtrA
VARAITTDEDQPTTFVELFFDLVFVFAVTQVVAVVHHDLSWGYVARGAIVFWLVWWAWTQFTWALNSADTTHPGVEGVMLLATAVVFAMAVAIPTSFSSSGIWFATSYIAVRVIGLGLYARVAWEHVAKRAPLRRFIVLSIPGLVAVAIGGAVSSSGTRAVLWTAACLLDVAAAAVAGNAEGWDIRPEHFGERHGLFVIIALGESLIVAASSLSDPDRTRATLVVGLLALVTTCGLWWNYFVDTKPVVERVVAERRDRARSVLARDIYSIGHFPIIFGVVLFAVAVEEGVDHPSVAMPLAAVVALAAGLVLFIGGTEAVMWRAGTAPSVLRMVLLAATVAGIVLTRDLDPIWPFVIAAVGTATAATVARVRRLA